MKIRDLLCLFNICGWKLWADRLRLITRKNFLTVGGIQQWDALSGKESSEFAIIVGIEVEVSNVLVEILNHKKEEGGWTR